MLKQDQARVSIGARVQVSFVQVQAQKLPFFELL
jgi:ubiquinone/menaquinone biosynthesis C-methylase UbiE